MFSLRTHYLVAGGYPGRYLYAEVAHFRRYRRRAVPVRGCNLLIQRPGSPGRLFGKKILNGRDHLTRKATTKTERHTDK